MTSILEALRELEEERRRTRSPQSPSVADAPAPSARSSNLLYPLVAGLAVGVLAVAAVVWWVGFGEPVDPTDVMLDVPAAPAAPGPSSAAPAPAAAPDATVVPARDPGPAWLTRADAPAARVDRDAPPRTPPAASRPAAAPSVAAPVPGAPAPAGRPAGSVTVDSIRFAEAPERRSVTLRLDGRRVTLRQGERAAGIEVQLILEDGVYLNRGSDVVFAVPGG